MIELFPTRHPQLVGCNPFGFRTNRRTKTTRRFRGRAEEQEVQEMGVSKIKQLFAKLQLLPCEFAVKVGVEDGRGIIEGQVKVYERRSFTEASEIFSQIQTTVTIFGWWCSPASFLVETSQTMTITRIYSSNS